MKQTIRNGKVVHSVDRWDWWFWCSGLLAGMATIHALPEWWGGVANFVAFGIILAIPAYTWWIEPRRGQR